MKRIIYIYIYVYVYIYIYTYIPHATHSYIRIYRTRVIDETVQDVFRMWVYVRIEGWKASRMGSRSADPRWKRMSTCREIYVQWPMK